MKVRGIAMWASVQSPNTTFDPVYCVDLIVDDENAKAIKNVGLRVKKTEEGNVVKFKRKQFKADKTENEKPVVVDAHKNPFTKLIGNGSEVIVQFSTYEWSNNFGSGVSADLQGVQVIKHVPFRVEDGEEFEVMDEEETVSAPLAPKAEDFDDDLPDVL